MRAPAQTRTTKQPDSNTHAAENKTPAVGGPLAVAQAMLDDSPQVMQLKAQAEMMNNSPRQLRQQAMVERLHPSGSMVAQRTKLAQLSAPVQRAEDARAQQVEQAAPNHTGLPDGLKAGVESLSGMSMDHVKVHYNSSRPAQLNALAYAQGSDIHLGPGQERHLPHEAWHVVQQAQGRVKPTMQMKGGTPVNDDAGLEAEADAMGAQAVSAGPTRGAHSVQRQADSLARVRPAAVIQAVWSPRTYNVSGGTRTLQVDDPGPVWGATGGAGNYANNAGAGPRAILFETMCRNTGLIALRDRLNQPGSLWDTGLTVVVNKAYTPAKIYDGDGNVTSQNSTQGQSLQDAQGDVNAIHLAATAGWNGMPINVVKAVWERREVKRGLNAPALEQVAGSVPYSTFRVLAANSPGAGSIEAALKSNHGEGKVWRKMGDDDMPYVDPNGVGPETGALADVESDGAAYAKPTLVTFGYNLVTAGTAPPITGILQGIYAKEMALRDAIAELGAPMYPSEPTTFYQPRIGDSVAGAWTAMEGERVGGSGQQLEGAKFARALNKTTGYEHVVYHSIMVNTGAAARNDALVALLNGWYNNGMGDISTFRADEIEACINGLDQSALKHDEYLKKVVGNLKGELSSETHAAIEKLVKRYRMEAAQEARDALVASIPAHVTNGYRNQRYLDAWSATATARDRYTPDLI
jgi:hypothetical protein